METDMVATGNAEVSTVDWLEVRGRGSDVFVDVGALWGIDVGCCCCC